MKKKCEFSSRSLGCAIVVFCSNSEDQVLLAQVQRFLDCYFKRAQGLVSEIVDENRHHKSLTPSGAKPWYQVDILFRKWNIVCDGFFEI